MTSCPLILTASSLHPVATTACQAVETAVRAAFPGREILWGYNQRSVDRARSAGRTDIHLAAEQLHMLGATGCRRALVQPLHLLPGSEFHQLHRELRRADGIAWHLGAPLCASPADFTELTGLLAEHLPDDSEQAILLLGHGTRHPSWTSYLALHHYLRLQFGKRAFVGVVEHYPHTPGLAEEIYGQGYRKVLIVPFFFAGGIHLSRDILGDADHSWRTRLVRAGLSVDCFGGGIGTMSGIERLIIRHINEAQQP